MDNWGILLEEREKYGKDLKTEMFIHQVSVKELSEHTGISKSTISSARTAKRYTSEDRYLELFKAIDEIVNERSKK